MSAPDWWLSRLVAGWNRNLPGRWTLSCMPGGLKDAVYTIHQVVYQPEPLPGDIPDPNSLIARRREVFFPAHIGSSDPGQSALADHLSRIAVRMANAPDPIELGREWGDLANGPPILCEEHHAY